MCFFLFLVDVKTGPSHTHTVHCRLGLTVPDLKLQFVVKVRKNARWLQQLSSTNN